MATQSSKIDSISSQSKRGSEKLMKAWKSRALTDDSVREIADALDKSPAEVAGIIFVGGEEATGLQVSLRYDGDDGPYCGNDILFWLKWLQNHGGGGVIKAPHILINGTPWPEEVLMTLTFGQTGPSEGPAGISGAIGEAGE
jgi:hypothetical protein